jgi:hypothetical protein
VCTNTGFTKCSIPVGSLTGTCKECGINTDCPTGKPKCSNGSCYVCVVDGDCDAGSKCLNGGTSTAQCVSTCTTDAGCQSDTNNTSAVCAYKGTAYAACAIPCSSDTACAGSDNPTPGATKCWGYINGTVTQNTKPASGSTGYCVTTGPQKCCWNRTIQSCNVSGDCEAGGEGCINSGDTTQQYGKLTCNTCASQGKIMNDAMSDCVLPYSIFDGAMSNNDYAKSSQPTLDGCTNACLNDTTSPCVFFNYDTNTKECWLQRPPRYTNVQVYYKQNDGSYTSAGPYSPDNNDMTSADNKTIQTCKDFCTATPNCITASFESSTGRCFLKGVNTSATTRKTGVIRKTFT